jgi:predicted DCC family thiol-disulfide oxidoreductase YuxK
MVFDGDCGFCRTWIDRWRRHTGENVTYVPYQEAAAWYPDIPEEDFAQAVHLIEGDGRVSRGAEAVCRALAIAGRSAPLFLYQHLPGCSQVSEAIYRQVARRRQLFSHLTEWLWGAAAPPSTWWLSRWIFLKGLALVYLAAFVSLLVQVDGLIGPAGILPAERYLEAAHGQVGSAAYYLLPTLAWLHPGGAMPEVLCAAGALLSLMLLAGFLPRAALAGLWALYLSVTVIGQDFLSFQWDSLLLETGFLAIFLAPGGLRPGLGLAAPPSAAALFVLRWTLFRLVFMAGAVKLLSGDLLWRQLTALTVHYETQPLPHALSWFAHQLPAGLHQAACLATLVIELAVPFLIWMPRRLKQIAWATLVMLQVVIMLTGNYGFFNLLTVLLCILLLDDRALTHGLPARLTGRLAAAPSPRRNRLAGLGTLAATAVTLLTLVLMTARLLGPGAVPAPILNAASWAAPLQTFNNYGLFAVMTPDRPEIQIEGSDDGQNWKPYVFRWKPGDPALAPRLATPHMPRLDWQMWFAALAGANQTRWFGSFLQALLEGRPEVLALLADNPFEERPPRYVRAVLYKYRFTTSGEPDWWQREEIGLYARPVALRR